MDFIAQPPLGSDAHGEHLPIDCRPRYRLGKPRNLRRLKRAIIAPHEDHNHKSKMRDANRGGHQLRRDDQPIKEDSEAVGFNFHFQIANGTARKACSVRVQAHNFHDATGFFRENWPTIELMARESLAAADGAEIKLAMPPSRPDTP